MKSRTVCIQGSASAVVVWHLPRIAGELGMSRVSVNAQDEPLVYRYRRPGRCFDREHRTIAAGRNMNSHFILVRVSVCLGSG
jgi:hypothetical protein